MKKITTLSILMICLSANAIVGQTIITSASFPEAGDVLKTRIAAQLTGDFVTAAGADQTWDFTSLASDVEVETEYLDAANADSAAVFPNAQIYTQRGLGEEFFESTDDHFGSLGITANDPVGLGFSANTVYDEVFIERVAWEYGDAPVATEAVIQSRFALADLPDFLADTISGLSPIPIDSLGFGVRTERSMNLDAWGTLEIPGGTYDVLRVVRTDIRNTILESKVPFLGWTDVTDLLAGAGGGFGNFGSDTSYTHIYYSNDSKEPIAVVNLSDDLQSANTVQYKNNGISSTIIIDDEVLAMNVAPNPTSDLVTVEFSDLPKGDYQLQLVSANGKLLKNRLITGNGKYSINESLRDFANGTYFWVLKNQEGNTLKSYQLIKQ